MAQAIALEWVLPGDTTSAVAGLAGPRGINTWGSIAGDLADQADLAGALDAKQPADGDLTAIAALSPADDAVLQRKAGAWTARSPGQLKTDLALTKSDVGLGAVEDIALGTWAGSGNVATLGTVVSGTWAGSVVAPAYGGTGQSSYAAGDLLYASDAVTLDRLPMTAGGNVLLSGATPNWGKADLAAHVTGTLAVARGGTGQTSSGAALNALLPSQSGAVGKVLTSDGTSPTWQTPTPPTWGAITGVLASQTDLQTALNGKLSLAGGTMTGALGLTAGAVGAPSLCASGDTNTGLWFPAADTLAASVGGVEAWRVDSSARVGVGTTSLSAQFSVQSGSATRQAAIIKGTSGQTANLTEWQSSSGTVLAAVDASGHLGLNKAAVSPTALINIAGTNNERIDTTGNAYGIQLQVVNQLSGNLRGISIQCESRYGGSSVALIGVQTACIINSGANSAANIATGFHVVSPILFSSATISSAYGLYIESQAVSGVSSAWGIYSAGTNDNNYIANNLLIGINSVPSALKGGLVLGNVAAAPTGNVSGGSLYVEAGALKFRGGGGTVTNIANA